MDSPDEINYDISQYLEGIDQITIDMIRLKERIRIFSKLRNLIYQKQRENDQVAQDVLGWAYEKLAD